MLIILKQQFIWKIEFYLEKILTPLNGLKYIQKKWTSTFSSEHGYISFISKFTLENLFVMAHTCYAY